MRPHHLELTAFGPFPGTVQVDLDALADSGLFLLHGETGAGKTTLLDALGFALYGRVPGERGKARRLRSDHADPQVRTVVRLDLTLAGRRLRITRSPEQSRPKQRGSGTTTEPARMVLQEARAEPGGGLQWRTLSTRVEEGSREVIELMGMSADQFFQVVLLPQNDFARFLRASSEERGALLQRLFATDRFGRAEDWLAEQRRVASAARDRVREDLRVVSALVHEAASAVGADETGELSLGQPRPGALAPAATPDEQARRDSRAAFEGQPAQVDAAGWAKALARSRELAVRSQAGVRRAQEALDEASTAAVTARSLADRQRRRAAALARQRSLDAGAQGMARLRGELAAADRAARAAPLVQEWDRRSASVANCRAGEQSVRRHLARLDLPADAPAPEVEDAVRQWRGRSARLDGLSVLARDIAAEEEVAASSAAQAGEAGAREDAARLALDALPGKRAEAVQAVEEARSAAERVAQDSSRVDALRAAWADANELAAALKTRAVLVETRLAAHTRAVEAREHAVDVRAERVDGMIAELAAALEDGTPCPVCGSLSHPDPSEVRGRRVSREEEDEAFQLADELRDRASAIASELAAQSALAEQLSARLAAAGLAEAGADELAAALAEQERALARSVAVAGTGQRARERLAELDARASRLAEERSVFRERRLSAQRHSAEAAERAAQARASLAAALGGAPDLPAAQRAAEERVAALEAVLAAAEEHRRAEQEEVRARSIAVAAAESAGFPDVESAQAAVRAEAWRIDAAQQLDRDEAERAAVRDQLADPELDVVLDPPADVAAAETALGDRQQALAAAQAEASLAGERAATLARLVPEAMGKLAQLAPLEARADEVRVLADLVNGSGTNALRMTLTSFVLAARLEEVASAATDRLQRMTQGRYALAHTDTGRGGARAGLGLLVRDYWTGQDRDTATLSGGETFLASLALALGLADVVAAESGGAPIEALFIDEGFGTLDADTLESVMDSLDGLREGGRLVGVVSHVAELRQRIPAQVRVRKGRAGSDLTVVGCA